MPVARSEKFIGDALAFPTALCYRPPRCGMHSRLREVSERLPRNFPGRGGREQRRRGRWTQWGARADKSRAGEQEWWKC